MSGCNPPSIWFRDCTFLIWFNACSSTYVEALSEPERRCAMRWNQRTILLMVAVLLVVAVIAIAATRGFDLSGSGTIYPVQANGKFGFISKSGKLEIPAQFDDAKPFHDGLAPVLVQQ